MLLPEEIENQQFEVSFRGYNTREVDEFLNKLHSDIEEMVKEQEVLKRKIAAAELLAKDAKDHEEEFIASMQADRNAADDTLSSAKTEGERIIREAKNAAAGIMTEVRRRAGEISAESRKASAGILEEARRSAAEITDAAKAEAEQTLYAARTEADNVVKAAAAQAKAIETEARMNSVALTEQAEKAAALSTEYMNEIRTSADMLCRELDAELKNSAARITLLGRRIAAMDITPPPAIDAAEETDTAESTVSPAPAMYAKTEETPVEPPEASPAPSHEPAYAKTEEKTAVDESAPKQETEPVKKPNGGYFTKEYRQVMEELFGADANLSPTSFPEDDDTYDYLDKVSVVTAAKDSPAPAKDEDMNVYDSDEVTSEYTGIPSSTADDDLLDVFSSSTLDRVYKSPSEEDINDIMNNS